MIRNHPEEKGVTFHLGERLEAIGGNDQGSVINVRTKAGNYPADLSYLRSASVRRQESERNEARCSEMVRSRLTGEMKTSFPDI